MSTRQIWGMPIVVGMLSAVGLLSALLGDGVWDALSWISLAIPIVITLRHVGLSVIRHSDLVSRDVSRTVT